MQSKLIQNNELDKQQEEALKIESDMLNNLNNLSKEESDFWLEERNNVKVMFVYGDTGGGKTGWVFKHLQGYKGNLPVYVFKHPNPEAMAALGYRNLYSASEIYSLTDCVLWVDEPSIHFPRYDKKSNVMFETLCTLARQKGVKLIFSSADSRWLNLGMEAYVTHWIVKKCEVSLLKRTSTLKKIIRQLMPLATDEINLKVEEYLLYSRDNKKHNGLHTFKFPLYFDDRLSKAYKYA